MQIWYLEGVVVNTALTHRGCRVLKQFEMDVIEIQESKSELFFFEKITEAQQ
jgi:hypothetical protein